MGKSRYVLVHWPKNPSSVKVDEDESLTWFPSVATEKHISGAADIFIWVWNDDSVVDVHVLGALGATSWNVSCVRTGNENNLCLLPHQKNNKKQSRLSQRTWAWSTSAFANTFFSGFLSLQQFLHLFFVLTFESVPSPPPHLPPPHSFTQTPYQVRFHSWYAAIWCD